MYESFIETLKQEFKKNVVAAIKFGAEGEPTNLLVVLNRIDYTALEQIRKIMHHAGKKMHVAPLFFTKKELIEAADVFPLEFLDIKYPHTLLYGVDVMNMIQFDRKSVRRQLEYEVRSKLIHLREHFIWIKNPEELRALLWSAVPSLLPLCYGLLFLKNTEPADELDTLIHIVEEQYKIDLTIFKKIKQLKKAGDAELWHLVKELMEFLRTLSEIVDMIKV